MKIILPFIIVFSGIFGAKYFKSHRSNVIHGDLIVSKIEPIDKEKSLVHFQPNKLKIPMQGYYNSYIHFKAGDTITVDINTATQEWATSINQTSFQLQLLTFNAYIDTMLHAQTTMINGYEWSM